MPGSVYFGNPISLFTIQEPHKKLQITAKHRMAVSPSDSIRLDETPTWESVRDLLQTDRSAVVAEAIPFRFDSLYIQRTSDLASYAEASFPSGRPIGEAVLDLFLGRGYRMFALNSGRLEERTTLVADLPWKDYFFIHPTRAAALPDGVFKARMAG